MVPEELRGSALGRSKVEIGSVIDEEKIREKGNGEN